MPLTEVRAKLLPLFIKLWGLVYLLTLVAAGASGQGGTPLACTVSTSVTPLIRAEGASELVGDVVLNCTGGTPTPNGNAVPQGNIQLFLLGSAAVTSRILSASGTWGEPLLIFNEPGVSNSNPQLACASVSGTCAVTGAGPSGTYDGSTGHPNIFQGSVVSNMVNFLGIPIDPPGPSGTLVLRITNVRANASAVPTGPSGTPGQLQAFLAVSGSTSVSLNNPTQVVAFVQPGESFQVRTADGSGAYPAGVPAFDQCGSAVRTPLATLRFAESFSTAFRTRTTAAFSDPDTAPAPAAQPVPGAVYNTESGFYNPALTGSNGNLGTAGLADFGTRLRAVFTAPAGVSVWVSTSPVVFSGGVPGPKTTGTLARLVSSESGAFAAVPATLTIGTVPAAELPVTGGSVTAVWEITSANPLATDMLDFAVWVSYRDPSKALPLSGSGIGSVAGGLAPAAATSAWFAAQGATFPLPRFADVASPVSLFNVTPCLSIQTTSLPPGLAGYFYNLDGSIRLSATGGTPPYSWVAAPASVPPDIQVSGSGIVRGTPWAAGNYALQVTVTDAVNRVATGTVSFQVGVAPAPVLTSPANGATNVALTPTLTWGVASGTTSFVYLGTTNPPSFLAGTSSSSYTPPALEPGRTYYWYIEASGVSSPVASFTTARTEQARLVWQNNATGGAVIQYMRGAKGDVYDSTVWLINEIAGWRLVTLADFNRDGTPDAIWQNVSTGGVVVWYLGGPQGATLLSWEWITTGLPGWKVVCVRDLNHDGVPDLVLQQDSTRAIGIWYMGGGATGTTALDSALLPGSPVGYTAVGMADFNGDGNLDLVLQKDSSGEVSVWYLGPSSRTYLGSYNILSPGVPGWRAAALTDLDRDGKPDLIWQNDAVGVVAWYLNGPQGNNLASQSWLAGPTPGWTVRQSP